MVPSVLTSAMNNHAYNSMFFKSFFQMHILEWLSDFLSWRFCFHNSLQEYSQVSGECSFERKILPYCSVGLLGTRCCSRTEYKDGSFKIPASV